MICSDWLNALSAKLLSGPLGERSKRTATHFITAFLWIGFCFLVFVVGSLTQVRAEVPLDLGLPFSHASFDDKNRSDSPAIWGSLLRGQSDDSLNDIGYDTEENYSLVQELGAWDNGDFENEELGSRDRRFDVEHLGTSTLYTPIKQVSASTIVISSQCGWKGVRDEFGEVYVLYGDCQVQQAQGHATAPIAVVWLSNRSETDGSVSLGSRVYVYLEKEGNRVFQLDLDSICTSAKTDGNAWLGEFQSLSDVELRIALPGEDQLRPDEVYFRALSFLQQEMSSEISETASKTSSTLELPNAPSEFSAQKDLLDEEITVQNESNLQAPSLIDGNEVAGWKNFGEGDVIRAIPETAERQTLTKNNVLTKNDIRQLRFRLLNRYEETPKDIQRTESSGDKDAWTISNGFTLIVQGLDLQDVPIGDTLELSADSAVIWTSSSVFGNLNFDRDEKAAADLDFEIYLEGNVVFREGNSVVYAKKMYYDVRNRIGVIENAEMLAEVPGMEGAYFRLGADKIVQENEDRLRASNAWVSTSMMGTPTYRLHTDSLVAERSRSGLYDALTGQPAIDPKTGLQATNDKQFVIAENNFVSIGNLPVFYWPWMAMDVRDRAMYLKSLKFGHDGVLGTQVQTGWDLYQLLQVKNRPSGTEWDLDLDYLSRRGLGHGTTFKYERDSIGNWDTRAVGLANFYGIYDKGLDNLGHGRRQVGFENKYRYRGIWKHRQELNFSCLDNDWINQSPWTFTGQIGKSSDRNFIPEFFEDEWNSSSNPETRLELKRTSDNRSLGLDVDVRTDNFYTQTNWLPKLSHYWVGQSLWDSPFVWYEHTKVGYAQFNTTESPYDPADADLFRYLDWELNPGYSSNGANMSKNDRLSGDGLVFSSRQEVDLPLFLGPIKTTPYALGEYGFWGEGVENNSISRLYGRLGVRFNLPIWKVDSDVESKTWYVNGLAHKMNFVVDASYSDANKNYNDLVLYDQIDDWQVQDFRRRYSVTTFSGAGPAGLDGIPVRFDERYYAIRQGALAGNVTSPSTELVDDQQLVRLGWNNRWQTKRGPVNNRRVVDWITLNAGISLYPKHRDNFWKTPGLIDYDACWQVGDRFAVLSSGLYDVWGTGQKITRIGVQRKRPSLSSCYLGIDRLSGPIDSTYLNFGLTYRTSEKWGLGFSNSYDLSEGYNIGQKMTISRIGESFVVTLGASRNESKDNWGVNLSIEPVFLFDKEKRDEGLLGLGNM